MTFDGVLTLLCGIALGLQGWSGLLTFSAVPVGLLALLVVVLYMGCALPGGLRRPRQNRGS